MRDCRWGAIALAAVLAVASLPVGAAATVAPTYVPDPNNDKAVLVQGWTGAELDRIVGDFAQSYQLPDGLYALSTQGKFLKITFPRDLSPTLFSYLVNYIQYPKELDLKGRAIACLGVATLTPGFPVPTPLYGQRGLFYVPAHDADFDRVYVKVGSQAYVNAFGASEWQGAPDARMPQPVQALAVEIAPARSTTQGQYRH